MTWIMKPATRNAKNGFYFLPQSVHNRKVYAGR